MRTVDEWIGKTDDTPLPERIKRRIIERQGGRCAISGVELTPGSIAFDHRTPLWQGGANRESNIQALWDKPHRIKTSEEAAVRKKVFRVRDKHLGLRKKKPWNGGLRKKMDGTVIKK